MNKISMSYINDLHEKYKNNRLVPFLGAGLSKPFKVPDWKKLISDISNEIVEDDLKPSIEKLLEMNEYWLAVNLIKKFTATSEAVIQGKVHNIIKNNIIDLTDNSLHNYSDLANLKQCFNFITTNYDKLLSKYIINSSSRVLHNNGSGNYNINSQTFFDPSNTFQKVWHLHGIYDEENTIVLSEEKYNEVYMDTAYTQLFTVFQAVGTLLFIGFSFDDHYIQDLFEKNKSTLQSNHYILLDNPSKAVVNEFSNKYNIRVIEYDSRNSSHAEEIRKILNLIVGGGNGCQQGGNTSLQGNTSNSQGGNTSQQGKTSSSLGVNTNFQSINSNINGNNNIKSRMLDFLLEVREDFRTFGSTYNDTFEKYLIEKYLQNLDEGFIASIFNYLWQNLFFIKENTHKESYLGDYYIFVTIVKCKKELLLKLFNSDPNFYSNIKPSGLLVNKHDEYDEKNIISLSHVTRLSIFLSNFPEFYNSLRDYAKIVIEDEVKKNINIFIRAYYLSDNLRDHLDRVRKMFYSFYTTTNWTYIERYTSINEDAIKSIYKVSNISDKEALIDFITNYFTESPSYASASYIFHFFVKPTLNDFTVNQLIKLLQGMNNNSQIYKLRELNSSVKIIKDVLKVKTSEEIDYSQFSNL